MHIHTLSSRFEERDEGKITSYYYLAWVCNFCERHAGHPFLKREHRIALLHICFKRSYENVQILIIKNVVCVSVCPVHKSQEPLDRF